MTRLTGTRSPPSGAVLGRWRLIGHARCGSFGLVFRAQLTSKPGTLAALKLAREPMDARFEREAKLLEAARSPYLPRLLDKGEWISASGHCYPYIVMEWVEGLPLYVWRNEQGLTHACAAQALAHVAHALAELHRLGGVHRDVKGDNVLVSPEGHATLVDLGASWLAQAAPLTDGGVPPGTEAYRSPELLRFRRSFRRDPDLHYQSHSAEDLYALGVMAYRLVVGAYPAPLTDPDTSSAEPPDLLRPGELATVAPELERLILQMLSENREERGTAAELAKGLEQVAASAGAAPIVERPCMMKTQKTSRPGPRPSFKPPAWLASAGAAVVGGLVVLLGAELHRPHRPTPWLAEDWGGAPPSFAPDAGVGEEAMLSVVQAPRPASPSYVVSLPMPKGPLPGQKKPPCDSEIEVAALGACWVILKKEPPCKSGAYELDGLCVRASFDAPRQPTSEQP